MPRYRFSTSWRLEAPRAKVFEALHDSESWPQWWPGLEAAIQLTCGDAEGRGTLGRYTWRSAVPYRLDFYVRITRVERPALMEGVATGALTGVGRFTLREDGEATEVTFEWDVRTTRAWMNLLAPVAGPVLRWNHDWIMRQGGAGLARRLGVPLVSSA